MNGLMMDGELTLTGLANRAERFFGAREIVSRDPAGAVQRTTYGEAIARARRVAAGLRELGIGAGDRVATLLWNQPEHLELYVAVAGDGRGDPHAQPATASRRAGVHRRRRG